MLPLANNGAHTTCGFHERIWLLSPGKKKQKKLRLNRLKEKRSFSLPKHRHNDLSAVWVTVADVQQNLIAAKKVLITYNGAPSH